MKMKHSYGIISGAGPMAGALMYEQVINKLQLKGAWLDHHFPSILLMNVPFSPMLDGNGDNPRVQQELLDALELLKPQCHRIYIACQTLHLFLTEEQLNHYGVISLLHLTQKAVSTEKRSLKVIASKTSRQSDLHGQWLKRPCNYVEPELAEQAIEAILKGQHPDMQWAVTLAKKNPLLLGCTEFSVALKDCSSEGIIDPVLLAAEDIVSHYLNGFRDYSAFIQGLALETLS